MSRNPSHLSDDLLQRYHDAELSAIERGDVEARIDGDARLRLEALDELGGLLRTHAATESSGVDFSSLIDAIEKSPPAVMAEAPPRKRRSLVPLSALSAFAAGAFALFFFLRSGVPSNEAQIESLEVSGGSATVLRMPDDKNGQTTTIIWASLDDEGNDDGAAL